MASKSADHDRQKGMSSTDRGARNHHLQKLRTAPVSSRSISSPDNKSNNTQNADHSSRGKGSGDLDSKAASKEPSFQPCKICKLDDFILPSLGKSKKAGAATPCPNEHVPYKKAKDEDDYELVDNKETIEEDQFPEDRDMVMIDSSDDEMMFH